MYRLINRSQCVQSCICNFNSGPYCFVVCCGEIDAEASMDVLQYACFTTGTVDPEVPGNGGRWGGGGTGRDNDGGDTGRDIDGGLLKRGPCGHVRGDNGSLLKRGPCGHVRGGNGSLRRCTGNGSLHRCTAKHQASSCNDNYNNTRNNNYQKCVLRSS